MVVMWLGLSIVMGMRNVSQWQLETVTSVSSQIETPRESVIISPVRY